MNCNIEEIEELSSAAESTAQKIESFTMNLIDNTIEVPKTEELPTDDGKNKLVSFLSIVDKEFLSGSTFEPVDSFLKKLSLKNEPTEGEDFSTALEEVEKMSKKMEIKSAEINAKLQAACENFDLKNGFGNKKDNGETEEGGTNATAPKVDICNNEVKEVTDRAGDIRSMITRLKDTQKRIKEQVIDIKTAITFRNNGQEDKKVLFSKEHYASYSDVYEIKLG